MSFDPRDGRKRHSITFTVTDVELSDVFGVCPVRGISLDIDLPLPAETIEVIDKRSSEKGLQSVKYILQSHALFERFVSIDPNVDLGDIGEQCRSDSSEFRSFASGCEKGIDVLREILNASITSILKDHGDSPRHTQTRNRRRRKCEYRGLRELDESKVQSSLQYLILFRQGFAILRRIQVNENEASVAALHAAQQAETSNACGIPHSGSLGQDGFNFPAHRVGTLERGCIGQLQVDIKETLIFVG